MFKKGFRREFFDGIDSDGIDFSDYVEEEDDFEFVEKKKVKRVYVAS